MPWRTLDDGQHVYIGSGGEFQPRGPTAPKGAANRAGAKGPGGMAAKPISPALHEKMTKSANAASVRAAAARARGDRRGELQAHEHRALIIAKQNDFRNVHKSGQGQVAPAGEKTAAAALVARVRMGKGAGAPAPAETAGVNAAFKASATREEITAAAKGRAGDRAGLARMRVAGGNARVGDYVQAPHGDLNIRRPALVEGRVIAKSADGRMLTIKRGDGKTFQVNAGVAHPVGKGQERFTPERAMKAAELRAGRAPAAPARPAAPSLREQAATGLPHPSTFKGMSAPAGDAAGLARERGRIAAGVSAVRASATAAQSRERFARGEHDAAGVYREGAKVVVTGTKTITNPVTGKGKVKLRPL